MERIELFYLPVPDLARALAHYRDALGWSELWREGDTTAAVAPGGGEVGLMLDTGDGTTPAGPMVTVDDVRQWVRDHEDRVTVTMAPVQIPGGWWAGVADPFGNTTYVIDQGDAG